MIAFSKVLPLAGVCALAMSAGFAHAADIPAEAPPVYSAVPAANWAGFYAGSLIGYGWTDAEVSASGLDGDATLEGPTAGALLGYNWQSGSLVFGVEGDITLHEIRDEVPLGAGAMDVDSLYSIHARGRIGYDLGRFLPFVAGGFTANETYVREDGVPYIGANEWMYGWNVGAGVDFSLGETFIGPVTLRVEYLYESLSSEVFTIGPNDADVEHSTHFVRGAIISSLGGGGRAAAAPAAFDGDWSGAYGGLMAGFGTMQVDMDADDLDADGGLGGIYTGRNFQFGNLVVGFDGATLLTNLEGSGNGIDFRNNIQIDARGRLGYAMGDFLPFIAGGVSWTRSEQQDSATPTNQEGRVPAELWTVGAGLDYRITPRMSVRGEYLYGHAFDVSEPDLGGGGIEQDIDLHEVRFGTAYHF